MPCRFPYLPKDPAKSLRTLSVSCALSGGYCSAQPSAGLRNQPFPFPKDRQTPLQINPKGFFSCCLQDRRSGGEIPPISTILGSAGSNFSFQNKHLMNVQSTAGWRIFLTYFSQNQKRWTGVVQRLSCFGPILRDRFGIFSESRFVEREIRISLIDLKVNENLLLGFSWNVLPELLRKPDFFGPHFAVLLDFFSPLIGTKAKSTECGKHQL